MQGPSRVPAAKTPAIPQASKFKSQRKLDLPLVIRQLSVDRAPARRFRERGVVSCITVEYVSVQTTSAEVWMVREVEEFCPELQQARFPQYFFYCYLYHREVP